MCPRINIIDCNVDTDEEEEADVGVCIEENDALGITISTTILSIGILSLNPLDVILINLSFSFDDIFIFELLLLLNSCCNTSVSLISTFTVFAHDAEQE